jgi:hypothetical protein
MRCSPVPDHASRVATEEYTRTLGAGLGVSLVGISTPAHLDDLLAVARTAPMLQ